MLPRKNRVPSITLKDLRARGIRIRMNDMDFVYRKTQEISRFAVVVPARVDKRATARNRMKRLVLEAVRFVSPPFPVDGVFFIRNRIPDATSGVVELVKRIFAGLK